MSTAGMGPGGKVITTTMTMIDRVFESTER